MCVCVDSSLRVGACHLLFPFRQPLGAFISVPLIPSPSPSPFRRYSSVAASFLQRSLNAPDFSFSQRFFGLLSQPLCFCRVQIENASRATVPPLPCWDLVMESTLKDLLKSAAGYERTRAWLEYMFLWWAGLNLTAYAVLLTSPATNRR